MALLLVVSCDRSFGARIQETVEDVIVHVGRPSGERGADEREEGSASGCREAVGYGKYGGEMLIGNEDAQPFVDFFGIGEVGLNRGLVMQRLGKTALAVEAAGLMDGSKAEAGSQSWALVSA